MGEDAPKHHPVAPLIVVAGPTASGKSALAVSLALHFDGEVVNCDAMQVYRGFDIGAAKLTPTEMKGVRHHLIDYCDPGDTFSAGDFSTAARSVIAEISSRGRIPIVAGGTGFYIRALLDGLFAGPGRDEALRSRLKDRESARPGSLHRILQRLDPIAGKRIHRNDTNKVIRALEVCLSGRRLSDLHAERKPQGLEGYRILKLFLDPPREAVYKRINQRCIEMFQSGLLDEVRRLVSSGVSRASQPFLAVGYREALAVIDGLMTVEQAIELTQIATRHYAKRQWTWFRRDAEFIALSGFGTDPTIIEFAKKLGESPEIRGEIKSNSRNFL